MSIGDSNMEYNKPESSESEKTSEIQLEKQERDSNNSSDTQSKNSLNPLVGVILLIVLFPALYYVGRFVKNIRFKSEVKARNRVQAIIDSAIPQDGVYGNDESLGGGYVDPIHNFFKVQPRQDCEIKANKLQKTFKIEQGTNAGRLYL